MSFDNEDTAAEPPIQSAIDPITTDVVNEFGMEIAAISHRGCVRSNNEDHYVVLRRSRSAVVHASSVADADLWNDQQQHVWLLMVADGVGGQVSGEIASSSLIQTVLEFANELGSWMMRHDDTYLPDDMEHRLSLYSDAIQAALARQVENDPNLEGMATTATSAYVTPTSVSIANVGDSRIYLIRAGQIQQLTRDHTLAQELMDRGLSREQTRAFRNLVTRAFTTDGGPITIDHVRFDLEHGDRLLLCSDGLTDLVSDDQILEILMRNDQVAVGCEQLVSTALERGGTDNVTVILARIGDASDAMC
jgi:protein phosphatase